ncbi:MAG: hypothetical protein KatS3mg032_2088 [Cyclobacteriaceae bacterium]|nr:MAG: hypothetical protein KatS3mg032_2088 [Cyclobacteriaceae bacterium]
MLYRTIFLFVVLFGQPVYAQSSSVLNGRIITSENGTIHGVAYATLMAINHKNLGSVADEKGNFLLAWPENETSLSIAVHCLGFRDTILAVSRSTDYLQIELKPQPVLLSEVVISKSRLTEQTLGITDIKLQNGKTPATVKVNKPGAGVGNAFYTGKKRGYIETVGFYANELQENRIYKMEIFGLNGRFEDFRVYSSNELIPLCNEPVILETKEAGWITYRFTEPVYFEQDYVIVSFTDVLLRHSTDKVVDYLFYYISSRGKKNMQFLFLDNGFCLMPPENVGVTPVYVKLLVEQ